MGRDFVKVVRDGFVATVTIDRPDKLNALDAQVIGELRSAFAELAAAAGVRAAILTGAGKAFVAGADISAMSTISSAQAHAFASEGHALGAELEGLAFPVIAAVNGFALGGGCELAMSCDFIYASEKAKFGQPEVKLGVIPGFGGTQRLLRRVGIAKARELVYTGAVIDAAEALRIGLADAVFSMDELLPKARAAADTISQMGPVAIREAKQVLLRGADLPLPAANAAEVDAFARCFATADQKEGMAAFLEKRAATFSGN